MVEQLLRKDKQTGVELGLTQAETVSLELGLIRAGLENIIWSYYYWDGFGAYPFFF